VCVCVCVSVRLPFALVPGARNILSLPYVFVIAY